MNISDQCLKYTAIAHHQAAIVALLLTAVLWVVTPAIIAADKDAANVDDARTTLKKWVETRRIISQEKRDWALAQEVLNERIDLVQREIDAQRAKIFEAETSTAEVDQKWVKMHEENEDLREATETLSNTLTALEERTQSLLKRLPEPIRVRVRPLSQRIPVSADATKLSLAERFQNLIGILNEVNKFDREITVTSEVHKLPDGTSAEVTALYVGISMGYYVSRNGKAAGVGTAAPDGWVWKPANDNAAQVAKAIAILNNEQVASFVKLPMDIQ
jgi:hypothetical protein